MMNETTTPTQPQASKTPHPPRGATTCELRDFIQTQTIAHSAERRRYYLENYLTEVPPLTQKEALKHDFLANSFSTQIEHLQNTLQFLLLKYGEDKLETVIQLQRRFCETVHLLHKIKKDNHKIKNSAQKPKAT